MPRSNTRPAEGSGLTWSAPGIIRTPLSDQGLKDETLRARVITRHPIGRIGEPEGVSSPVLWFCSEKASFVTGAMIPADGGMLLLQSIRLDSAAQF